MAGGIMDVKPMDTEGLLCVAEPKVYAFGNTQLQCYM